MEPITEARLRRATERAVARGHAIGALLFGSRARGTAGPLSDWDVCLVTDEDAPNIETRGRALEAADECWENGNIERFGRAEKEECMGTSGRQDKEGED